MVRVVPDTNILISALMFGGLPGTFLDLAFLQSFQLVTSSILLDELDEKLRLKFKVAPADADFIRARLEKSAILVTPDVSLAVIKDDPDDDRVLECAIAGKADYVVSGDRHLLTLGAYEGIPILSVRRFMDAIDAGI
ncbi:MAG: putative toxin-antitoxin system toxin component, PIN family [Steroidobacteraceae bacterium]